MANHIHRKHLQKTDFNRASITHLEQPIHASAAQITSGKMRQ
jgi:hypothetical protein